jgi:hypothetical protein
MLPFALYAYHTVIRMFTGATSYSFVYGMEAIIQLKIEITSLRVLMESKLKKVEWVKIRYE